MLLGQSGSPTDHAGRSRGPPPRDPSRPRSAPTRHRFDPTQYVREQQERQRGRSPTSRLPSYPSSGPLMQTDLFTTKPLVPSISVTVSGTPFDSCTAMYCQDRPCFLKTCHCNLNGTVSNIFTIRSAHVVRSPAAACSRIGRPLGSTFYPDCLQPCTTLLAA